MSVLSRIAAAGAIAAIPVLTHADGGSPLTCVPQTGSQENCTPLVGCLGDEGDYFMGRALGWGAGAFVGASRTGFACHGEWKARNALGLGQATILCDNGVTGVAYFTYQDSVTGTAKGHGALGDGRVLRMWSGHNLQQFIGREKADVNARLMCGAVPVPIS